MITILESLPNLESIFINQTPHTKEQLNMMHGIGEITGCTKKLTLNGITIIIKLTSEAIKITILSIFQTDISLILSITLILVMVSSMRRLALPTKTQSIMTTMVSSTLWVKPTASP